MSLSDVLSWIAQAQHALLKPSPVFGLPWMDVLGTPRLSIALDQVFRQVNLSNRPSFFSEVFAIVTLIFAGDLAMPLLWPDLPPSLLLTSSTPYLLFGVTHALFTRTIVNRLVPKETGLKWEGLASVFDGLTRAIVVCTLFIDNLSRHSSLQDNWFALVALSWVGISLGALVVEGCSMWNRQWSLTTPPEFKAWGWTTTDFWVPPVFATLYLHLTRPYYSPVFEWLYKKTAFLLAYALPSSAVKPAFRILSSTIGEHRQPWSPDTARALCGLLLISIFLLRTAYNFGGQLRWRRAGLAVKKEKKAQGPKMKTQ